MLHIYIYNISRLRVKDLHSATYIYVVRRLRVNMSSSACNEVVPAQYSAHCIGLSLTSYFHYAVTCVCKLLLVKLINMFSQLNSESRDFFLISTYALQPSRLIVRSGLDVPTFATRRPHACHHARAPSCGRWNCGREMSENFA